MRRRMILLAAVVVGVVVVGAAPGRTEPAGAGCGWTTAGGGGPTAAVMNQAFPDADGVHLNVLFGEMDAHYWQSYERIPEGGHIEYHGEFPHARYMSFTNYGGGIRSVDGIYDAAIVPDPGSSNPFLPHADRTVEDRWFTVRFADTQAPPGDQRAPNTFYRINEDGSNNSNRVAPTVSLRIYTADRGAGPDGGVPLPIITKVSADGTRETLPACSEGGLPSVGHDETLANSGIGEPWPENVVPEGDNPPRWTKFTSYAAIAGEDDATGEGGFGDNPDQKYISTTFRKSFGEVVVFRGKAPTFVDTWDSIPRMGTGQLRFWTFCTYATTTNGYDCRRDDTVPLDAQGYYTVVVSSAASRPSNAVERCGVTWLPSGPSDRSIVILRNLLPAPTFAEAIHNTEPGDEVATLGEYYPFGRYYPTTADFEALGCGRHSALRFAAGPSDAPTEP